VISLWFRCSCGRPNSGTGGQGSDRVPRTTSTTGGTFRGRRRTASEITGQQLPLPRRARGLGARPPEIRVWIREWWTLVQRARIQHPPTTDQRHT